MGMRGAFLDVVSGIIAEEIVQAALAEAISVMRNLGLNEGQTSILNNTLIPKFEANSLLPIENGWEWVSASPYEDFMSETVEAGNIIMEEAFNLAQAVS